MALPFTDWSKPKHDMAENMGGQYITMDDLTCSLMARNGLHEIRKARHDLQG